MENAPDHIIQAITPNKGRLNAALEWLKNTHTYMLHKLRWEKTDILQRCRSIAIRSTELNSAPEMMKKSCHNVKYFSVNSSIQHKWRNKSHRYVSRLLGVILSRRRSIEVASEDLVRPVDVDRPSFVVQNVAKLLVWINSRDLKGNSEIRLHGTCGEPMTPWQASWQALTMFTIIPRTLSALNLDEPLHRG